MIYAGSIIGNILFKFPVGSRSISDRLSEKAQYDRISDKVSLYGIFVVGFIGLWLIPSLMELGNAQGII